MSHRDNKNSKENKKAAPKTHKELKKMEDNTKDNLGFSNESRKLGKGEIEI